MFHPIYTITDQLLANIKRISILTKQLNDQRFPSVVLLEYAKVAREVSTHASTSIEGNPLPLTEVKKLLKSTPHNARDTEKEVLNYNLALEKLDQLIQVKDHTPTIELILDVHKLVTQNLLHISQSGKFRQSPVVVNNPSTGQVVYLPPDIDKVESLMRDLIEFISHSDSKVDPLIIAGIFHKQMVIIHPFMDGNGRTTRLITKILLARMGLNTFNLFSFENYYNKNITQYFRSVGEYGDYNELISKIDFTTWLEYFTSGIIDELLRVGGSLPMASTSPATSLAPHHLKILDYLQQHSYIADRDYKTFTKRAKATRALDFQKLISLGLIKREGKARSTYYILQPHGS